jgi:hypothetical protein
VSLRRIDVRFALPRPVRRAVVLGDLPSWREGLAQAGIETVPAAGAEQPQLVVAPSSLMREALTLAPEMLVLEGGRRLRSLQAGGWSGQVLLLLPDLERPELLLPAGEEDAVRYAVRHWREGLTPLTRARNVLVREFLARGFIPPGRSATTVAARSNGPPFLVAAALEALPVDDVRWFAAIGTWAHAGSRGAFYLFPPDAAEPAWVVKFARVPGLSGPFVRDEQGLRLAERTGGIVATHAPRLLGRFEVSGLEASIETAATGSRLTDVLRSSRPARERLAALERVASWIVQLARDTSSPPQTLEPELRLLADDVVPRWTKHGLPATLIDDLPPVPAVFQHGDLHAENVFLRGDRFTVVDWESAQAQGMPLWDILYFLTDALAAIAGVNSEDEREEHFVRLWRGDLASSEVLFRWTRATAQASGVPADAVGPVATLLWLSYALGDVARSERRGDSPSAVTPSTLRFARRLLTEPGLGAGWDRWRK